MASCKIFQIYYDDNQKESLYNHVCIEPTYNPLPNTFSFRNLYYTLENKVILENVTNQIEEDYVAVWSHKHFEKVWNYSHDGNYNKARDGKGKLIPWMLDKLDREDIDVLGFHRHLNRYHQKHLLTMAERFHKNFNQLLRRLLVEAKCGDKVSLTPEFPFVSLMNYQVVRKDIYLLYIEEVLKPVMNAMIKTTDTTIQTFLFQNANYRGQATPEQLLKIGGKPYYTMHTFILERLFTLWISKKQHLTNRYKLENY